LTEDPKLSTMVPMTDFLRFPRILRASLALSLMAVLISPMASAQETPASETIDPEIERLVIATEACSVFHPKRCEALKTLIDRGQSTIAPLFTMLRRTEGKRRAACVRALAYVGDTAVGTELLALMKDRSEDVRIAAIDALSRLKPDGAVEALAQAAGSEQVNIKITAVVSLGRTRSPGALEPLLSSLEHFHPKVKSAAARSLGQVGDARATEPLMVMLADPVHRTPVRHAVVEALGLLGDTSAVPMLLLALGDGSTKVRVEAVQSLGRLKDPRSVPALSLLLREESLALPISRALMTMGHAAALPALIRAIRTPTLSREAREACFTALGSLGSKSTVSALTPFLAAENLEVARWAASALGRIGHRDAAEELLDAMNRDDPALLDMAAWALQQISGKKLGQDPAVWKKWVYGDEGR
jgi:HEAT repeat protein